jgi:diadenosine tetraphosphatase ApaH/serine/threonine PP2A family protein phosphatase
MLLLRPVLACVYDVHGNLAALEAVLADARGAGADRWLLGGDYALFGGWPEETVTRLRELDPARWIRGNGERWTARPDDAPEGDPVQGAIAACREALGDDLVDDLASLPFDAYLDDTGVVHASPVSDVRSFFPEPADDEDELLAGVGVTRLVFGHTHLPFRRTATRGGIELVNPGSVGMPFDRDPRAAYALLHDDGTVEHRRVDYDHEASAARVRERFGGAPWTGTVARRIELARPDV